MQIRPAAPADVPDLVRIKSAVWPDQAVNIAQLEAVLQLPEHIVLVASTEGEALGYLDCFLTTSVDGVRRWEMDEIAVLPAAQGRGIGRRLVANGLQSIYGGGATYSRALIQVENIPSQRIFAHAGYRIEPATQMLLVAGPQDVDNTNLPQGLHLVPVSTLSYCGAWLEGEVTLAGLEAARQWINGNDCQLVGVLICSDDQSLLSDALLAGYEVVDSYNWWSTK
ncbi:MAG: GNAT family N-acetyltransferase [Chloroflexi bacterium]|nr:GNAT family N-acetyltransferase [Chloroflexota bacterium]